MLMFSIMRANGDKNKEANRVLHGPPLKVPGAGLEPAQLQ